MNWLTDNFRVAVLPLATQLADKETNLEAVAAAFGHLPEECDMVVLPELFSTGFSDDPDLMREMAERNTGPTIDFVKRLAHEHGVAVAGTFLASTPPHLYNRAFVIEPSGEETFYDKRHLFSPGSEAAIMRAGTAPLPVVSRVVPQPRHALRYACSAGKLAFVARLCLAATPYSACNREPVLCGRRRPWRQGLLWRVRRSVGNLRLSRHACRRGCRTIYCCRSEPREARHLSQQLPGVGRCR